MRTLKQYRLAFLLLLTPYLLKAQNKINIACIGNSITYGYKVADREHQSYPAQLQTLLGNHYMVSNFGVNGATLLHQGNKPFIKQPQYWQALASRPDVVLIKLGTNDSKLINRIYLDEFERDYQELIGAFAALPTHPRIILLTPIAAFTTDTIQIWDKLIREKIIPHIQQVAYLQNLEVINLYQLFINQEALLADKIHPDAVGDSIIAKRLFEAITAKRDQCYDIFCRMTLPKDTASFYGYDRATFMLGTHECKIVKPKWSAPHHPWVWRARFWGHEPQTDIALLERGFHIVYCDVAELYGNKTAVYTWNQFYKMLYRAGLAPKAVMEGMSRGGVYVYNWAAVNPKKIACVYVDNAVLDLKSWPGAMGKSPGSKADWQLVKQDFNLKTKVDEKAFKNSPMDHVAAIVKGHYAMLHLLADADEVVPPDENTLPFAEKVKALGGNITVMHKPGFKHHPHSFPNPTPIVDFILRNVSL